MMLIPKLTQNEDSHILMNLMSNDDKLCGACLRMINHEKTIGI